MGDEIGKALAEALEHNSALQRFVLICSGAMGDQTGMALAEALKRNSVLQVLRCDIPSVASVVLAALQRNRQLLAQWQALASLGRVAGLGVSSAQCLRSRDLRSMVLSYFAPAGCTAVPRFFPTALRPPRTRSTSETGLAGRSLVQPPPEEAMPNSHSVVSVQSHSSVSTDLHHIIH